MAVLPEGFGGAGGAEAKEPTLTKQLTKQLTNLVQEFDAATEAARVSMKVDAEAKVAAVAAANDSLAKLEAFRAAQKALADAVNAVTMEGQSP